MGGLLQEFWNHTDAAFAVRYWQAMNAYNTDTNGVNVDDFTTCWVHFDQLAFQPAEPEVKKIVEVPVRAAHVAVQAAQAPAQAAFVASKAAPATVKIKAVPIGGKAPVRSFEHVRSYQHEYHDPEKPKAKDYPTKLQPIL